MYVVTLYELYIL